MCHNKLTPRLSVAQPVVSSVPQSDDETDVTYVGIVLPTVYLGSQLAAP
jgi:hypothetical protein